MFKLKENKETLYPGLFSVRCYLIVLSTFNILHIVIDFNQINHRNFGNKIVPVLMMFHSFNHGVSNTYSMVQFFSEQNTQILVVHILSCIGLMGNNTHWLNSIPIPYKLYVIKYNYMLNY